MWPIPQEIAGLVALTEEILNGKEPFFTVLWVYKMSHQIVIN